MKKYLAKAALSNFCKRVAPFNRTAIFDFQSSPDPPQIPERAARFVFCRLAGEAEVGELAVGEALEGAALAPDVIVEVKGSSRFAGHDLSLSEQL